MDSIGVKIVSHVQRSEVDPPGQGVAQTSRVAAKLFQETRIVEKRLGVPLQALSISRHDIDAGTEALVAQAKDAVEIRFAGRRSPRFDALFFEIGDKFRQNEFTPFLVHLVAPFWLFIVLVVIALVRSAFVSGTSAYSPTNANPTFALLNDGRPTMRLRVRAATTSLEERDGTRLLPAFYSPKFPTANALFP